MIHSRGARARFVLQREARFVNGAFDKLNAFSASPEGKTRSRDVALETLSCKKGRSPE